MIRRASQLLENGKKLVILAVDDVANSPDPGRISASPRALARLCSQPIGAKFNSTRPFGEGCVISRPRCHLSLLPSSPYTHETDRRRSFLHYRLDFVDFVGRHLVEYFSAWLECMGTGERSELLINRDIETLKTSLLAE